VPPRRRQPSRRRGIPWEKLLTRDTIWLVVGVAIVVNEVFFRETERPFVLALAGALMGLPLVLNADRWRNDGDK